MSETELLEYVKENFTYKDGKFFNKKGREVGHIYNAKYGKRIRMKVKGRDYYRSRLVFLLFHGRFPKPAVDHINRISDDDRVENLRECTASQNNKNRKPVSNTGHHYITKTEKPYLVRMHKKNGSIIVRKFRTLKEAIEFRDENLKKNDFERFKNVIK